MKDFREMGWGWMLKWRIDEGKIRKSKKKSERKEGDDKWGKEKKIIIGEIKRRIEKEKKNKCKDEKELWKKIIEKKIGKKKSEKCERY